MRGDSPRSSPAGRRTRAMVLALAGAGVALALAGAAHAAPPAQQPWSLDLAASGTGGTAQALDFDARGETFLVGTTAPAPGETVPGVPGLPDDGAEGSDLLHARFDQGNVSGAPAAGGRSAVAFTNDTRFAVVGGDAADGLRPNLFVYALPDLSAPVWTRAKAGEVSAVAANRDGSVIVATTRGTEDAAGRVFRFDLSGNEVWNRGVDRCGEAGGQGAGSALSLDLSLDGRWAVVGASFADEASSANGCVLLFDTRSITPVLEFPVRAADGAVTAVDMSPDGSWFAAGTAGGRFFLFRNTAEERGRPAQEQLNSLAQVQAVRTVQDGAVLVVADGSTVQRFLHAERAFRLDWSAAAPGLRSLDITPDGEYVVVGAQQLMAFHERSNRTLWSVDLPDALVRVRELNDTDIRIVAAGAGRVQGYRLHWDFAVEKLDPEPLALDLGRSRVMSLRVANTGSAIDTVRLEGPAHPRFTAGFSPPVLDLYPGETADVALTLQPREGAEAGFYVLPFTVATSLGGGSVRVPLNVTVGAVPDLGVALADPAFHDRGAFQGDHFDILILVHNLGNERLDLAYDVTQAPNVGGPWEASLSVTNGRVEAKGETTTTLRVQVPPTARNGTENVLTFTARGGGVVANTTARIVVNPLSTGSLEIIPAGKVVEPGRTVTYKVVAANNGTLREGYRLVYCSALSGLIPCFGNATKGLGGWGVSLDTLPFPLDAGDSRSFDLNVRAPVGAIPGVDKLVLQVELISEDPEHKFRELSLVTTSVIEPLPPEPRDSPGAGGALAALAAVAAAGAAARTCRRGR